MSTETKIRITVAMLKEDLLNGLNRKAIAQKYNVSKVSVDKMFKHPELLGLRPKHASEVELVLEDGTAISPNVAAKDYVPTKKAPKAEGEGAEATAEAGTEQADTASTTGNSIESRVSEATGV